VLEDHPDCPLSDYLLRRFGDHITYFNERLSEARRFDLSKKSAVAAALEAIDLARRSKVHVFKLQEAYRALLALIVKMRSSGNRGGFPTKHDLDPGQAV